MSKDDKGKPRGKTSDGGWNFPKTTDKDGFVPPGTGYDPRKDPPSIAHNRDKK